MKYENFKFLFIGLILLLVGWIETEQFSEPIKPFYQLPKVYSLNHIKIPPEDTPSGHNLQPVGVCVQYKTQYDNLTALKKTYPLSISFENIHLNYEDKTYRLRHFFKDSPEGIRETFLTYLEDQNDHPHIIEKSLFIPGPWYKKLLKEHDSIIYHEEAYTIASSNIFIHYINQKLIGVQGDLIDCVF
jgi:hypothetical protein